MTRGVRLGIDVGTVRVGVSASDPDGIMAFPVETVARDADAARRVLAIAEERGAIELIVGLPKHLSGVEGASAADAREFAAGLAELGRLPVRLIDERMSTVTAATAMRQAGKSARAQRGSIDAAAAVVILDAALEALRRGNLGPVAPEVVQGEK